VAGKLAGCWDSAQQSCWLWRRLAGDSWQQRIVQVSGASEQKKVYMSTDLLKRAGHTWGCGSGELKRENRQDN